MKCRVKLTVCQGAALLPRVSVQQDEEEVTVTVKGVSGETRAAVPIMQVDQVFEAESANAQSGVALNDALVAKRITATQDEPGCFCDMSSGAYLLDGWFRISQIRDDYGVLSTEHTGKMVLISNDIGFGAKVVLFDAANGELVFRRGSTISERSTVRTKLDDYFENSGCKVDNLDFIIVGDYPSAKAVYDAASCAPLNPRKALKKKTLYAGETWFDYDMNHAMLYIYYEDQYLPENARIRDVSFDLREECGIEGVNGVYYGTEIASIVRSDESIDGENAYVLISETKVEDVPDYGQKVLLITLDPERADGFEIFQNIDGYGNITLYYEEV